jgi:hypothetical protein
MKTSATKAKKGVGSKKTAVSGQMVSRNRSAAEKTTAASALHGLKKVSKAKLEKEYDALRLFVDTYSRF